MTIWKMLDEVQAALDEVGMGAQIQMESYASEHELGEAHDYHVVLMSAYHMNRLTEALKAEWERYEL